MQPNETRLVDTDRVDERTLKPVVKLLVVVGALLLVWGLLSNLPGVGALVPETGVTFGAVLGAAVTLGIVAALLFVALKVEPLVVQAVAGPGDLVTDLASLAKHVVLFVAVVTAHGGLAPLFVPSLAAVGLAWTYDALFLVLALVPTFVVAVRLYGNVDAIASRVTSRLVAGDDEERDEDASEAASTP